MLAQRNTNTPPRQQGRLPQIIVLERFPVLGRGTMRSADHVFGDGSLGHLEAPLEQLAVDAGCAPQWIGPTQLPNERNGVWRNSMIFQNGCGQAHQKSQPAKHAAHHPTRSSGSRAFFSRKELLPTTTGNGFSINCCVPPRRRCLTRQDCHPTANPALTQVKGFPDSGRSAGVFTFRKRARSDSDKL